MPIQSNVERGLLKALVAEDDPGIRKLIASMLELDGWEVVECENGHDAVEAAADFHPDAVVVDVMMPHKDGITAASEIRQQEGNDGCAVVVVSAEPMAEGRAKAMGSDYFIPKPFDPEDLTAKTRAALKWRAESVAE